MPHPDQQSSAEYLIQAGVKQGLVAKLREIHPASVVALARLRSWSAKNPKDQLPEAEGDIAVTEARIRKTLVTVFVAGLLQEETIVQECGPREVVVTLRHDRENGRMDIICSSKGNSKGVRPQTAASMALRQLLRGDQFREFFKSRMAKSVGDDGLRMVDQIKQMAAERIASGKIRTAVLVE